jgi:hypothetical protein
VKRLGGLKPGENTGWFSSVEVEPTGIYAREFSPLTSWRLNLREEQKKQGDWQKSLLLKDPQKSYGVLNYGGGSQ